MKKFNSVLIPFCRGIIKSALHFNNHYCLAVFQRSNLVSYIHVAKPRSQAFYTSYFLIACSMQGKSLGNFIT